MGKLRLALLAAASLTVIGVAVPRIGDTLDNSGCLSALGLFNRYELSGLGVTASFMCFHHNQDTMMNIQRQFDFPPT